MKDIEILNTALYRKIATERDAYRAWLLAQTPEEILQHICEYLIKEDIYLTLENNDLSNEQATALLTSDAPLTEIYDEFERREIGYMDTLLDCTAVCANTILSKQQDFTETPLYLHSFNYAVEHDETAIFRASHNANVACRDTTEKVIADNHVNHHFEVEVVYAIIKTLFGIERLRYILALTVQDSTWDGRYSQENKAWAETLLVHSPSPKEEASKYRLYQAHPVLIDALVTYARKQENGKEDNHETNR
ncbi:MAG: DUF3849 domain-containing protein [Oscillospiraceae bacterium]|nr:DUF3849 domain-containing protein [Oscillospiraceae bacterium]